MDRTPIPAPRGFRGRRRGALAALLLACVVAACTIPYPSTTPDPSGPGSSQPLSGTTPDWPIRAHEHVDLWLHGFAMLQQDTTAIPLFRRAYRDSIAAAKGRRNIVTLLDANADRLSAQFLATPSLSNAQFLALYFGSWDDMRRGVDLFQRARGLPSANPDPMAQRVIAAFASYFPSQPEREWLRLYVQALDDERTRFHRAWWAEQQKQREATLAAIDSLWQREVRPALRRFTQNAAQRSGELVLALPLEAEGRTVSESGQTVIAVGFPARTDAAAEAIYTLAHEVVSTITPQVINDHITPAEARSGGTERFQGAALVRGGEALLRKVRPDLVPGYARFYLGIAKVRYGTMDPVVALSRAFPLPDAMVRGLAEQIDQILSGI
jgi:hypothetical protein